MDYLYTFCSQLSQSLAMQGTQQQGLSLTKSSPDRSVEKACLILLTPSKYEYNHMTLSCFRYLVVF